MVESDEDEEYCDECGELEDDCECEEESTSMNDVLDGVKKGLDLVKTYKEITQPNSPNEIMKRVETERMSNYLQEGYERQQRISKTNIQQQTEKNEKEERRHKENLKWTKIGICVAAMVATILGVTAIIFN